MKRGDTLTEHQQKVARKLRELHRKGWSEARINVYMRAWTSDYSTHTSRKNDRQ